MAIHRDDADLWARFEALTKDASVQFTCNRQGAWQAVAFHADYQFPAIGSGPDLLGAFVALANKLEERGNAGR